MPQIEQVNRIVTELLFRAAFESQMYRYRDICTR